MNKELLNHCNAIDEMFARCQANAPNFGVRAESFKASLNSTVGKFLSSSNSEAAPTEVVVFLAQIQADDLFMAIACASGNERAWWEFDQQHRAYMERVARHLSRTEIDATDIVDSVYVQLYGTRIVDGERVSKFATYSGRGSIRGWLRTVIWHSLVDQHRASHDEVSLDEMNENVGEGTAHASFAVVPDDGEIEMIGHITRERYKKATVRSIEHAFSSLDDHEKLLLLYYHVENMKLREIARLVENEDSPLRGWFQRKSQARESNPAGRIHESTIMRWLEKSYAKVLNIFTDRLSNEHGLAGDEVAECMQLATEDISGSGFFRNLTASASDLSK